MNPIFQGLLIIVGGAFFLGLCSVGLLSLVMRTRGADQPLRYPDFSMEDLRPVTMEEALRGSHVIPELATARLIRLDADLARLRAELADHSNRLREIVDEDIAYREVLRKAQETSEHGASDHV
jgi:hypothetical protein